jgi:hypothetical protein
MPVIVQKGNGKRNDANEHQKIDIDPTADPVRFHDVVMMIM